MLTRINCFIPYDITPQIAKHLVVGASGVIVNWMVFSLLRQYLNVPTMYATVIVHIVLISYIFPLQKYFTFKSDCHTFTAFFKFVINSLGYITIDFFLAWYFVDFLKIMPVIGKAAGLALLTPLSFIFQKYWVFYHQS
jgi:putative flippase GtrA